MHAAADRKRDPWFSLQEIDVAARAAGVQSSKPLVEIVDVLRDQSYLMYQRRDDGIYLYKLASCQYGGGSVQGTTQGSGFLGSTQHTGAGGGFSPRAYPGGVDGFSPRSQHPTQRTNGGRGGGSQRSVSSW